MEPPGIPGRFTKAKPTTTNTVSNDDRRYFERLAQGNLAEVESGKLARTKAVSAEVRKFAEHMVADHGRMLDEQRSMATAKGLTLPTAPDKNHVGIMKRLQAQSGATFDRSYMTQMVKDHEDTLDLVKDIADKAKDPDLKAAGQKAIPQIQSHLDMAKRLASETELPDKLHPIPPKK